MELGGPKVRLRDVARLEHTGEQGDCSTAGDILVSVDLMEASELTFPNHLDVKLTPFTPKRVAVFLSPQGTSVNEAIRQLGRAYPGALVTAERDKLTVYFTDENPKLVDVPGLALRSMDDVHARVQVSGPEFERLMMLAEEARTLLAKEQTKWLGVGWPGMTPERVIKPTPGVKGLAQALQLAIGGITVGHLEDGTRIQVHAGGSLEDARLPDGRAVTDVAVISATLAPAAMLRINRQRTVELEVGLEPDAARRLLQRFELPPGYTLVVTAAGTDQSTSR